MTATGDTGDEESAVEVEHPDLDAALLSAPSANGGDVDRRIPGQLLSHDVHMIKRNDGTRLLPDARRMTVMDSGVRDELLARLAKAIESVTTAHPYK
jgi:hypothetical protein